MALSDIQRTAAGDITLSAKQGAQDRLDQTRKLEYSEGVWSKAQSKESMLSDTVEHVSINECFKWFTRTDRRDFVSKASGLVATPYKSHGFDRRGMLTNTYHDAYIADKDDLLETSVDPFAVVAEQIQHALGRLTDKVILQSMTDQAIVENRPKQDDFSTDATRSDAKKHITGQGMTQMRKQVTFLPQRLMSGNDSSKARLFADGANGLDDIEEVMHAFRRRDKVGTQLYCTYTPDLQLRMRTNPEWKNVEQLYSGQGVESQSRMGVRFSYKNLTFVTINEDALPELSANGGIETAYAGNNATIRCRSLQADDVDGKVAAAHPAKSATNREVQEVTKRDLVYIWEKMAVKFARQGEVEMMTPFTDVTVSLAKGAYSRVRLGGILLDEDCLVVCPLNGRRVA